MLAALGLGNEGRSKDDFFANTGRVPTSEDEQTIEAQSDPHAVGGRRSVQGAETYIEVRGPSGVGQRSSTPYSKVLPQYKKKAEEAIRRDEIPKRRQKRVKDYFDSLQSDD